MMHTSYKLLANSPTSTRPISTYGVAITPGATNVYGSWTDFGVVSTDYDASFFDLIVHTVATAGNSKCTMVEVGIDTAGGTSYTAIISNLVIGSPGSYDDGTGIRPSQFRFPLRIPAGASVGVRGKQNHATPTAFRTFMRFFGKPSHPEYAFTGNVCESIGANAANSQGTSIVPGTTAEGAWTLIGTCTRNLKWIDFGYAIDNTVITGQGLHVDVAYGDGTTFVTVIEDGHVLLNPNEIVHHINTGEFCSIPAGSSLYARGQLSLGTVDTGHTIALYGVA